MRKDDSNEPKSWYAGFEKIIFPKWLFDPKNARYRRRATIGYYSALLAMLILLIYATIVFIQHRTVLAFMDLGTAVALAGVIVYFRMTKGPDNYAIQAGIAIFGCFCIYLCFSGEAGNPTYPWAYTFPLTAMFLLGSRRGSIAVMLFLFTVTILLIFDHYVLYVIHFPLSIKLRLVLSLFMVSVLSYLFEQSREKANRRMNLALSELGKSKEEIEQQVRSRTTQLFQTNEKLFQEIQERKRAEEEYKTILHTAMDGFLITDMQGRVLEVNDAYCRLTGYSRDEMLTMRVPDIEAVEGQEETARHFKKIMKDGGDCFETRHRCKDGRILDIEVSVNYIDSGGGRLFVFSRDITERKQAEEALKESEGRFRNIIESSKDGIIFFDGKTRKIILGNNAMAELLGCSKEDLVGRSIPSLHPSKEWASIEQEFQKHVNGEISVSTGIPVLRNDGSAFYADISSSLITLDGRTFFSAFFRDITERKRAEEALRESEEKYRILASTQDTMYFVDRECRYRFMNRAHLLRLGVSLGEVIGRSYGEFHSGEDTIRFADRVVGVFATGNSFQTEHRSERDNKYFLRTFGPVKDLQGNITGVTVISKDITERKRLEEILKREQQEFKLIIDSSPIIIFYKDKNGKFIRVNKTFIEAFEVPEEELVGKTVFDLFSAKIAQNMTNDDQEVIKSGHPKINIIEQYESASGLRWVQTDKIPICDNNGIPFGLIGFAQDITERKKAEEEIKKAEQKYRNIFEGAVEGIFQVTPDGRYLAANAAQAHMLGYNSPEELIRSVDDISTQVYVKKESRDYFLRILEEKGFIRGYEVEFFKKDGSTIWVSSNARTVRDENGRTLYYEGFNVDITERKKSEAILKNQRNQLRVLSARLSEAEENERKRIVRELHDQVGQNLTAIGINLSILKSAVPAWFSKEIRNHLSDSADLVEQTTEYVRDLMSDIRPPVMDDFGLMASIKYYGERFSTRTGIKFNFELEDIDPRPAASIENAVFRIVQEALNNLSKHAQAKNVEIIGERDGNILRITILDDGVGFDTTKSVKADERRGWGLLTMAERAESISGRFLVKSQPGRGTAVIVEVPI